jgi:hypothetical protein
MHSPLEAPVDKKHEEPSSAVTLPPTSTAKKSYSKPNLIEYGSVAKLTSASGGTVSDGGGGGMKKIACL